MILKIEDDFDLNKIADSGQCFRWHKEDDSGEKYRIIAGGKIIYIEHVEGNSFDFSCT
ncbi:MAG: 8-oxoguanine DNA glycosylase, N-terminal domain-containing protein, partial [Butyrivibrio sp.]|nr:8-oxoguanine DNA glycosylase, N-terminal domain-containing protein [Butyrivibrio sp.]